MSLGRSTPSWRPRARRLDVHRRIHYSRHNSSFALLQLHMYSRASLQHRRACGLPPSHQRSQGRIWSDGSGNPLQLGRMIPGSGTQVLWTPGTPVARIGEATVARTGAETPWEKHRALLSPVGNAALSSAVTVATLLRPRPQLRSVLRVWPLWGGPPENTSPPPIR